MTAWDRPLRRNALAEVSATEVRTDIQGLRAVAVLLVLVFHLWPNQLRGGYVGVDVFFVISGYLITSHLLRRPPRRPRDFGEFWGRRLRRLLPASLLVIVVTVLAGLIVLPVTQLSSLTRDALSSIFYVLNWTLAVNAVDYLGATQAPSPLQHYWSLGVEEQFYLLWPFVVGGLAWVAARRARFAVVIGISAFVGAFLIVSVVWTALDPAFAYFATPTRLWELAAGGLVATLPGIARIASLPAAVRAVGGWTGLVLIAGSSLLLTSATPFPGAVAIFPVAGAMLVIAAQSGDEWWSPGRWLAVRPMQFVGDTSYAVYLWHYPLIVLTAAALGGPLAWPVKFVILGTTFLLAQATKVLVEDPVRRSARLRPLPRTYGLAAVATLVAVAVALLPQVQVARVVAEQERVEQENADQNAGCVGAQALADDGCDLRGTGITPDPAVAFDDKSDAYAGGCFADRPFPEVITCDFGVPDGGTRVALVGNSHAGQWLPALQQLERPLDLEITTYLASRCAVSAADQVFDTPAITQGCLDWGDEVVRRVIEEDYDLVVVTEASDGPLVGVDDDDQFAAKVDGYVVPLRAWADAGIPVVVLRDTPQPLVDVPGCVDENRSDPGVCDGPRSQWLPDDPMVAAAQAVGSGIEVSDLSDLMCGVDTCYSVIGGVLVYFDPRHLTATFNATLGEFLRPDIEVALAG